MSTTTTRATRRGLTRATIVSATVMVLLSACGQSSTPAASQVAASTPAATTAPSTAPSPAPSPSAGLSAPTPIVLADATTEAPLELVWSTTGTTPEARWTWTPTVAPDGRIWAASSFDDQFWIFEPDGTFVEAWGTSGKGDGQFRLVAEGNGHGAIAFGPDSGFYVADPGNARVQQFDAERNFVRSWGGFGTAPGEFIIPVDIDVDAQGHVYVYGSAREEVQEFDADGSFIRAIGTNLGPYAAVTPDGRVYSVNNNTLTLYRYLRDGSIDLAVDLRSLVRFATGLAVAPSGDVFIPTSDDGGSNVVYERLLQLGEDGTLKHVWPNGAEAVAVNPTDERIYLVYSDVNPAVEAFALPPVD